METKGLGMWADLAMYAWSWPAEEMDGGGAVEVAMDLSRRTRARASRLKI